MDHSTKKQGARRYWQSECIENARIILSTLNSSGNDRFRGLKNQIDYLIIDEACQAIELSTLIPFMLNPARVILVGD